MTGRSRTRRRRASAAPSARWRSTSSSARKLAAAGRPVILARHDLSTADIEGLRLADGVVTAAGARTSHAAVVARALGKVCLVGCRDLRIAEDAASCRFGSTVVAAGEFISLDGCAGTIYRGRLPVTKDAPLPELVTIEEWRSRGSTPVDEALLTRG